MKNPTEPNLKTEWFPLLTLAMSLLAAFYFHSDFAYLWPAVLAFVYAMFLLFPYFKINHQESAQLKEQWHKAKELSLSFLFTLQIVGILILSGQNKILLWALPILFLLFWGPPGSGKTTLALIIAKETKAEFIQISATENGKKDLMEIVERARKSKRLGTKTILFIDEIHRWNKAQQDALLPQVENGTIILIGATTENPSFAVNGALLSRVKVVVLEALSEDDLSLVITRAAKSLGFKAKKDVWHLIARLANGDARKALNILESAGADGRPITLELVKQIINKPNLLYDKNGEEHYNIISALHKSMRGGDASAAIYWTVRMLEAGEDPLYIARRLIRFSSEDIGLANNSALLLANATYDTCHKIGMPECGVILAHCAAYLAKSPKSIAAYEAYESAKAEIAKSGNLPVPLHIRNAPTKLMKDLNYGKGYKYTPLEDSSSQEYLPKELKNKKFI